MKHVDRAWLLISTPKSEMERMEEIRAENERIIREWFAARPGATLTDCAYRLGLSRQTVSRHMQRIRAEWVERDRCEAAVALRRQREAGRRGSECRSGTPA